MSDPTIEDAMMEVDRKVFESNLIGPITKNHNKTMAYLGSPYAHENPIIKHRRYELALMATVELMNEGHHLYSPIVHNHYVNLLGGPKCGWKGHFWHDYDLHMLSLCDYMIVLKLVGWEDSVGLNGEIGFCRRVGKDIRYRDGPDVSKFEGIISLPPVNVSSASYNDQLLQAVHNEVDTYFGKR